MTDNSNIILFLASWFPNRTAPNHGQFIEKHLRITGSVHRTVLLHVCIDPTLKQKKEIILTEQDAISRCLIYLGPSKFNIPILSSLHKWIRYANAYRTGFRLICRKYGRPKGVHIHVLDPVGIFAYILKLRHKIPYLITEHWSGFYNSTEKNFILPQFLVKHIIRNASFVCPVSEDLKGAMISKGLNGNYTVVPNSIDPAVFRLQAKIKTKIKQIIHVSNLNDHSKNFSGILDAFRIVSGQCPDFVLNVYHDCDADPWIQKAKTYGLLDKHVIFHGTRNEQGIADAFGRSDFSVMFSNYETFCIVLAESLSCGVPVITTDVPGVARMIDDKLGIRIPVGDTDALVKAILFMLDHYQEYNKESMHSFVAERFSNDAVSAKYVSLYKKMLQA